MKVQTCACHQVRHFLRAQAWPMRFVTSQNDKQPFNLVSIHNDHIFLFQSAVSALRILALIASFATGGWMSNFLQQESVLIIWSCRFALGLGCSYVNHLELLVASDGTPGAGQHPGHFVPPLPHPMLAHLLSWWLVGS